MLQISLKILSVLCLFASCGAAISRQNDELEEFSFDSNADYYYTDTTDEYAQEINKHLAENPNHNYGNDAGSRTEYVIGYEGRGEGSLAIKEKEENIRIALVNAMKDDEYKKKFAKVLPILRSLTPPQKVVLAALVSTQTNARPGRELTLPEVQRMLGNNRSLMLPIALDIANLVRESTKISETNPTISEQEPIPDAQALRRSYKENDTFEENEEDSHLGEEIVQDDAKYEESVKSSLRANEGLKDNSTMKIGNSTKKEILQDQIAMEDEQISVTLAMADNFGQVANDTEEEQLPHAEELRALHHYFNGRTNPKFPPIRRKLTSNRVDCERFSRTMCLSASDYPTEAIMSSILRNKKAMAALLVEFRDKIAEKHDVDDNEFSAAEFDRQDETNRPLGEATDLPSSMCPSIIKYARPKKARSATGQWKYIVNTGEHTQTLRLEKCSKPTVSCTFLTDNFKSRCVQVYNYHRLLSWDVGRGLHVDIFKIPTCCSCHIDGYTETYPPVATHPQETKHEVFPGEEFSQEPNRHPYLQQVSSEESTNLFQYTPTTHTTTPIQSHKKYNKLNLGLASFDHNGNLLQQPSAIKETVAHIRFQLEETSTPTFNEQSIYLTTPPRKPTRLKNQGLPSYLEAPKPPLTGSPVRYLNPPVNTELKRGTKRRRPLRNKYVDQISSASESGFTTLVHPPESTTKQNQNDAQDSGRIRPLFKLKNTVEETRSPIIGEITKNGAALPNGYGHKSYSDQYEKEEGDEDGKEEHRRVNYNYHPIIDFFEGDGDHDVEDQKDVADSRIDSGIDSFEPSGWRPMTPIAHGY